MYLKETKGVIGKGLKGEKGKGNVIKIKVIKKKKTVFPAPLLQSAHSVPLLSLFSPTFLSSPSLVGSLTLIPHPVKHIQKEPTSLP